MSKAFTKEDAGSEAPPVVPRRAPLPDGVPNYVTLRGLAALRAELSELVRSRSELESGGAAPERSHPAAAADARSAELEARIAAAVLVDPKQQPQDQARFGASVRLRTPSGAERCYRIVGVDEANAAEGRIAFTAPLARALSGKRVGDHALLRTPSGEDELEIVAIDYEAPAT